MKLLNPLNSKQALKGQIDVPPDKSIAQRSVILAGIACGISHIKNFSGATDPQSTLGAVEMLGVKIENLGRGELKIYGQSTIKEPNDILYLGNSGTGLRLLLGLLAGMPGKCFATLTGDSSLRGRPMKRVVEPLKELGSQIYGRENCQKAPLSVIGQTLKGGKLEMKVASAQLKSALLLSCLNASSPLTIKEPAPSRNHTEIMLKDFGANLEQIDELTVKLSPSQLEAKEIIIPGDISSAAFFLVAGSIIPGSQVTIGNIGLNPTRTGIISVLQRMGANLQIVQKSSSGEPIGEITVKSASLQGIEIGGNIIPNIIDELPILALAAAQAKGTTIIKDAEELRVKESDRLKAMSQVLSNLGVKVIENKDGLIIEGLNGKAFEPKFETFSGGHDHRIVMTLGIASLLCSKSINLEGIEWANVSFPGFFDLLESLIN